MIFSLILNRIKNNSHDRNIVIYGAGDYGYRLYDMLLVQGVLVKAFCVSHKLQKEEFLCNIPIVCVEDLGVEQNFFLIACHYPENRKMMKTLKGMKCCAFLDVSWYLSHFDWRKKQIQENLLLKWYYYLKIKIRSCMGIGGYLMGTPWYGNIGDHAITVGTEFILNKLMKGKSIILIPYIVYMEFFVKKSVLTISSDAIIFLQGGGNLGSLYPHEEEFRRIIVQRYPHNKIVIMPQSIFFHTDTLGVEELNKSRDVYARHHDITIISRDPASYAMACAYFNAKNYLAPDAALALDGWINLPFIERCGVLLVLRSDKEKNLLMQTQRSIIRFLEKNNIPYDITDTVVERDIREFERSRYVKEWLCRFRRYRMIITDRYHGVVFSLVTKTPVLAFKSFDSKISSGLCWFSDLTWVHYGNDMIKKERENIIKFYALGSEKIVENHGKYKKVLDEVLSDVIE